ncbi:nuclear transport factor 2 family protein [Aquirufa sp. ROCK2-A2]
MKTKHILVLLVSILLSSFITKAQTPSSKDDQENIKKVILKTFTAMKSVDSLALSTCFTPNAVLHVSQVRPEGNIVREVPIAKFVQNVRSRKAGEMDERVSSWGEILIDHEIASAWVPYEFYLNGKFTHKGVDAFLLIKVGSEWKIQTLMYNMQKE